jgi:serine-aspartate repeat-containing protein C/D/E
MAVTQIEFLEKRTLLAGTISGIVFDDLNGNGVRETGEPGLAGQLIYLDQNFNGVQDKGEPNTFTDATGAYSFTDLPNGIVRVMHTVPTARRLTAPAAVFHDVAIAFDTNATNRNFGNTDTAIIRGSVFRDLNNNARRDLGEPGLPGWTVFLDKNNNGVLDPNEKVRVTNAAGDYRFAGLTPGTYYVRVVQQTSFVRTLPLSNRWTITLTNAQSVSNRHFGQLEPGGDRP